jgi:hypothetical protein
MPKKATPLQILQVDRNQALELARLKGVTQTRAQLRQAQRELNVRLRQVEGLSGPGKGSFTAHQLRVTLAQIRHALVSIKGGVKGVVVADAKVTAEKAAESEIRYIQSADAQFSGIAQRLPIREAAVLDHAVKGTKSSVLRRLSGTEKGPGILERYGTNTIGSFEERLRMRFLAKTPWDDVRNELIAESPFLQGQPAHWAERIVRTEVMAAHNRAQYEGLRAVNKEIGGGMLKILVATFDGRTGADSYAVHGQIRRPHEAFTDWYHNYSHPPNRPNDRETVVPHNMDWPIPPSLAWKSDAEVSMRWTMLGNKRALPPRPKMTTVALDKIGKSA